MNTDKVKKTGSCLCGDVSFDVTGPLRDIVMCHCTQCQKSSGHHYAATSAADKDLAIHDKGGLAWYKSSDYAERGFCRNCGSNLFWRMPSREQTSILMGSFDQDMALPVSQHYFVGSRKHYYTLEPGIPQHDTFPKDIKLSKL